jgi:hypothetical protein
VGSYLIVFDGPLGGDQLVTEIRRRVAREPSSFLVLVPVPASPKERRDALAMAASLEGGLLRSDMPSRADQEHESLERGSRGRLELLMREIRAAGGDADGWLVAHDPLEAIGGQLRVRPFDEIIVATRPSGMSKWLHRDLAHRVERKFGLPVKNVTLLA